MHKIHRDKAPMFTYAVHSMAVWEMLSVIPGEGAWGRPYRCSGCATSITVLAKTNTECSFTFCLFLGKKKSSLGFFWLAKQVLIEVFFVKGKQYKLTFKKWTYKGHCIPVTLTLANNFENSHSEFPSQYFFKILSNSVKYSHFMGALLKKIFF